MSFSKKVELLGHAILQDFIDNNSNISIIKNALDLSASYDNKLRICCALEESENYNTWIAKYFPNFYNEFHIKKTTYYKLLTEIKETDNLFKIYSKENFSIPIEKALLITLWFLANGISPHENEKFNILPSLCLPITTVILKIISNMQKKYIVWPDKRKAEISAEYFFSNFGYPNVVGTIDNIHINFKPSNSNKDMYRNDNMGYSVILQGICNSDKLFINIFSGLPGSIDCSSVLKHSTLYKQLEESSPNCFFYNKYHLIANEKYPLRSWLMIPYRSDQIKAPGYVKHNTALINSLSSITETFNVLKCRWNILNFINLDKVQIVKNIIDSCCVLHNFCILYDDIFIKFPTLSNKTLSTLTIFDVTKEGEKKRNTNLSMFDNNVLHL